MVLCSDHIADLLIEDIKFNIRYQDANGGQISKNYYGFEIYESTYAPTYNTANLKDAFETATPGLEASVFFHKNFVVKAPGTAERYALDKSMNPAMRRHEIGFELHWVCVAIKDEGTGVIVSKAA